MIWTEELRELYLKQEFGSIAYKHRLEFVCELLKAITGLEDLYQGDHNATYRKNSSGGTEPLAPPDFAHAVALNQSFFDGICNLVLEQKPFPYKLELPPTLGWAESHLWLFPIRQWHLPPYKWGTEREKLAFPCWAYDYANGCLSTPDAIAHRYSARLPSHRRKTAKRHITKAQAIIDTANTDARHRVRIMLGMLALNSFLFLFFCNTGANASVVREIETSGEIDANTHNQKYRSIKFRADNKSVSVIVPVTFMPSLRRFMELRLYLLGL